MSVEFACRACGGTSTIPVLSLGSMPLVNHFVVPGGPEAPRYPLEVIRCDACALVQIRESVLPEVLFSDYSYFSSYSDSFLDHSKRFADESISELGLDESSLVVEAASNDG